MARIFNLGVVVSRGGVPPCRLPIGSDGPMVETWVEIAFILLGVSGASGFDMR